MDQTYIVFFTSLSAFVLSLMVLILKVCFKSKCSDVSCCWGAIKVHRSVELESQNISMNDIQVQPSRVSHTLPV